MLDPKLLRDNPQAVAARLATRGYVLNIELLQALENKRKKLQTQTQELQNNRNLLAKQIGQKKSKGDDASDLIAAAEANNQQLQEKEIALEKFRKNYIIFIWKFLTYPMNPYH